MTTIFYSWMTGRPNASNRGFVADALGLAVKVIGSDAELDEAPRIDKDTLGVPGAPDIATTIFEKIDRSDIFVADLTFIETVDADTKRPSPNPNVLVELGYALKTLGWERIILVFNEAFGAAEALPFDLRGRRMTPFKMPVECEDRAPERKRLAKVMEDAVRSILDHAEMRPRGEWLGQLAHLLVHMLAELADFSESNVSLSGYTFETWADGLRDLARSPLAERAEELRELGDACEHGAHVFGQRIGYEMEPTVEKVRAIAAALKRDAIDSRPLDPGSVQDAWTHIRRVSVRVHELSGGTEKFVESSRIPRLQEQASELGEELLVIVEMALPLEEAELVRLRKAVQRLRRVKHIELMIDGGETLNEITSTIADTAAVLTGIAAKLPRR